MFQTAAGCLKIVVPVILIVVIATGASLSLLFRKGDEGFQLIPKGKPGEDSTKRG